MRFVSEILNKQSRKEFLGMTRDMLLHQMSVTQVETLALARVKVLEGYCYAHKSNRSEIFYFPGPFFENLSSSFFISRSIEMKTSILLTLSLGLLSSCAHKVKVLDASAVSMTHNSIEPGQKLVEIGEVESQFCPDSFNDKGQIGLLDEAISAAQKKSGADWIMNASFWRDQSGCISVTGTGKKIKTTAATSKKYKKK